MACTFRSELQPTRPEGAKQKQRKMKAAQSVTGKDLSMPKNVAPASAKLSSVMYIMFSRSSIVEILTSLEAEL